MDHPLRGCDSAVTHASTTSHDSDRSIDVSEYCREVEAYLCRKNDGHLIRITGPSFDVVSRWASTGVPLKVAFSGIDRHVERYYRSGPRRRPVRVDFCEADVLDVFDEWRRATGITSPEAETGGDADGDTARRGPSLPVHLERVLRRLTAARVTGILDERFDELLERVGREMDAARGARGIKRHAVVDRLAALDRELIARVRGSLDDTTCTMLGREADEELAPFRAAMSPDAF